MFLLFLILSGAIVLVVAIATAPKGFEDKKGFHREEKLASNSEE